MKMMVLSDEVRTKVMNNWVSLLQSIEDTRNREALDRFFDELGHRILLSPASSKVEHHNCMPGGLAEHSLRVYMLFKALCEAHIPGAYSEDDVKIAALFHDIGKIGDLYADYYLDQDSDWHRDKLGQHYKINDKLDYLTIQHRSLFLLQHYGVQLSRDAFKAILLHDGMYTDDNRSYSMKEGMFALLLHQADRLASEIEKRRYENWLGVKK